MSKKPTRQSQTFNILQAFDKEDWTALKEYFASPLFFSSKVEMNNLADFIGVLCDYYQSKQNKNPEPPDYEYLFFRLYGKKKTDRKKINTLLSKLEKHLTTFFAHLSLKKDTSHLNIVLATNYLNRKMPNDESTRKYVESKMGKFDKELKKAKEKSPIYWYTQYRLNVEKSLFYKKEKKLNRHEYLKGIIHSLDFFHLLEKLKFVCVLLDRNEILDSQIDYEELKIFERYLEEMKEKIWEESLLFRLYYHLFKGLIYQDTSIHYQRLQEDFFKYHSTISSREQSNFRQAILNYFLAQKNKGNNEYQKKLYKFYQNLLSQNLITSQGNKLEYNDYRNIVLISLSLGNWNWAKKFVEKYEINIESYEHAENTYAYCNALLCFYQKKPDYEKAIDHLSTIQTKYVFFELWRRMLLIRCRYELNDTGMLVKSEIKSLLEYIRREKVVKHTKDYQNCVEFLRRLVKREHLKRESVTYQKIKTQMMERKPLLHQNWLLEKLEEKVK